MRLKRKFFRKRLFAVLKNESFSFRLEDFRDVSLKTTINGLFRYLCLEDSSLKWHSVTAFGMTLAELAQISYPEARLVCRRLIWNLNDEGGGIGWGVPEAMGESFARHKELAGEYAKILVSYCMDDVNFLEHEPLQRGVAWGLGRLAKSEKTLLNKLDSGRHLLKYLDSPDRQVRAMAAWAEGILGCREALPKLFPLLGDQSQMRLYEDCRLRNTSVDALAKKALERINRDIEDETSETRQTG